MKTNYLKELAVRTAAQENTSVGISKFVLNSLSRSQLREYVRYLRRELAKNTLTVVSATPLHEKTKDSLLSHFGKKYLENKIDPTVGAGLVIVNNDDIIDLSVVGEIRRFIRTIA